MVIPMLDKTDVSEETDYLAIYCRSNLMLTIHAKSFMDRENLASLSESDSWLPGPTIGGLLSAMMITLSLRLLQWTIDLRANILELEGKMDRDPEDVEADNIFDLRTDLLTLGSAASDQLPVLEALHNMERDFLESHESRDYLNCAVTNVKAADASLGWLDQRIGALRSGFDMFAQDKTNRRLNMLTVLSAIFMPITLMAGIWGMNFENMPELKYAFAYPLALGTMLLIGVVSLIFFKKFGWFD